MVLARRREEQDVGGVVAASAEGHRVPSSALVGVISLRVLEEVTGLVAASIRATGMVPDAAGQVVGRGWLK
jgi:hypothetical protein